MGTIKNGVKWSGASINSMEVGGIAKDNKIIYKAVPHFILKYTDTSDSEYIEKYYDEKFLKNRITEIKETLKTCKITSINKPSIKICTNMFSECRVLEKLDLSSFDTSNVTSINGMFSFCTSLTSLDLSNFYTSNVSSMNDMFNACTSLMSLDLSSFDTSNVIYMISMFRVCRNLKYLDISNFDFTKVTSTNSMFLDVPTDCLIYVKDQQSKDFILSVRNDLTNVVIKT